MSSQRWLPFVIHPQTGAIHAIWHRDPFAWPEGGFVHSASSSVEVWPFPRLKDARVVDCAECGKTGVQPLNYEVVPRYVPGVVLVESEGMVTVHLPQVLAVELPRPTGSGEDEVADQGSCKRVPVAEEGGSAGGQVHGDSGSV